MNEKIVENKVKVVLKKALKGEILSGQDIKTILEFQNKKLEDLKGERLNDMELGLLGMYSVTFN